MKKQKQSRSQEQYQNPHSTDKCKRNSSSNLPRNIHLVQATHCDINGAGLLQEGPIDNSSSKKPNESRKNQDRKQQFIDSRSILTNKVQLKRFWERRMEMELNLKKKGKQPTGYCPSKEMLELTDGKKEREIDRGVQTLDPTLESLEVYDANNNLETDHNRKQSVSIVDKEEEIGDKCRLGDGADHGTGVPKEILDSGPDANPSESVELEQDSESRSPPGVCGELLQDSKDEISRMSGSGQRPNNSGEKSKDLKCQDLTPGKVADGNESGRDEAVDIYLEGDPVPSVRSIKRLRRDQANQEFRKHRASSTGHGTLDQSQPLSIDPTLCHPEAHNNEEKTVSFENLALSNESIQQETREEEQFANEDFSSSNSSFGPMSISIPNSQSISDSQGSSSSTLVGISATNGQDLSNNSANRQNSNGKISPQINNSLQQSAFVSDDDEQNSAQSGSVSTVINAQASEREGKMVEVVSDGQQVNGESADKSLGASADQAIIEGITDQFEQGEADGGNIGVAFESLQFDDQVKSSKNELVDEERLLGVPRLKTGVRSCAHPENQAKSGTQFKNLRNDPSAKFDSKEVKSVCSLIAGAISDATKQMENFMKSPSAPFSKNQSEPEVPTGEDARETYNNIQQSATCLSQMIDCQRTQGSSLKSSESPQIGIQRAKFVREDQNLVVHDEVYEREGEKNNSKSLHNYSSSEHSDGIEKDLPLNGAAIVSNEVGETELNDDDGIDFDHGEAVPKADLSSIFEANVKREIERFEANSMVRRQRLAAQESNCLTEWRIAEEIRQFNEREKELKLRTGGAKVDKTKREKSDNGDQQLELIVRCGKTFQIPKSTGSHVVTPSNQSYAALTPPVYQQNNRPESSSPLQVKSIKLTATCKETNGVNKSSSAQGATMISMHKFIASGGKKFIYTSATGGGSSACLSQNNASSGIQAANQHQFGSQHSSMTKSMSNLSGIHRQSVDYRAIDSLTCKEVPNVEPGIARKTIETFSRMSSGSSSKNDLFHNNHNCAPNAANVKSIGQQSGIFQRDYQTNLAANSAEWKIQEELRDMRAREAELRDLRNQRQSLTKETVANGINGADEVTEAVVCETEKGNEKSKAHFGDDKNQGEFVKTLTATGSNPSVDQSGMGLNDSLYPIKQTIDSFRRLDLSNQKSENNDVVSNQCMRPKSVEFKKYSIGNERS